MNTPTLKPDLFGLKQRLTLLNRREYSWAGIAREAGLNVRTVTDLAAGNGGSRRVDLATLEKLLGFFRAEGLHVTLCDLLIEADPSQVADEASVG